MGMGDLKKSLNTTFIYEKKKAIKQVGQLVIWVSFWQVGYVEIIIWIRQINILIKYLPIVHTIYYINIFCKRDDEKN